MIKITPEQRDDCYRFAKLIVDNDIIYDRFNYTKEQRIEKLAFGKLGEVAFYNYLTAHNIKVEYPAIFSLLGADKYDFKTYERLNNVDLIACLDKYLIISFGGLKKRVRKSNLLRVLNPYGCYAKKWVIQK